MARWCHGRRRRCSWHSEYCGEPASGDGKSLQKHDRLLVGYDHYIDLDSRLCATVARQLDSVRSLPHGTEVRQSVYQFALTMFVKNRSFVPCLIASKRRFLLCLLFQLPFFTVPSSQAVASDST